MQTRAQYGSTNKIKRLTDVLLDLKEFNQNQLEVSFNPQHLVEGKILGKGKFGLVVACKNLQNGGSYAAKKLIFSASMSPQEQESIIKVFESEIDILKRLKHPKIVQMVF